MLTGTDQRHYVARCSDFIVTAFARKNYYEVIEW